MKLHNKGYGFVFFGILIVWNYSCFDPDNAAKPIEWIQIPRRNLYDGQP